MIQAKRPANLTDIRGSKRVKLNKESQDEWQPNLNIKNKSTQPFANETLAMDIEMKDEQNTN